MKNEYDRSNSYLPDSHSRYINNYLSKPNKMKKKIHDIIIVIIAIAWFSSLAPLISCTKKLAQTSSKDSSYVETLRDTTVVSPCAKSETSLNIDSLGSLISGQWYEYFDSLHRISIAYMRDKFGRLNLKAETKPSTFNFPIKTKTYVIREKTHIESEKVIKVVPEWVWFAFGLAAMACVWMYFRR